LEAKIPKRGKREVEVGGSEDAKITSKLGRRKDATVTKED
jgi:hypothetical protein